LLRVEGLEQELYLEAHMEVLRINEVYKRDFEEKCTPSWTNLIRRGECWSPRQLKFNGYFSQNKTL